MRTIAFPAAPRVLAALVQAALRANSSIAFFVNRHSRRTGPSGNVRLTLGAPGMAARPAIWPATALWVLQNHGINATARAAGLEIGGIAVDLAAQSALEDPFASLAIVFDRSFKPGDLIGIGDRLIGRLNKWH